MKSGEQVHLHEPEERYVRVRVTPGVRTESVRERSGVYHIAVREKAEGGLANARVRDVLARALGLEAARVRLVKGATSPSKLFLCRGASVPEGVPRRTQKRGRGGGTAVHSHTTS